MKDGRITVRFSAELRRRLKDAAQRNGMRESEIVRKAVERQFAAEDGEMTAYERAEKAGTDRGHPAPQPGPDSIPPCILPTIPLSAFSLPSISRITCS